MQALLKETLESAAQVILGKPEALHLSFACLLARGHLLIEDIPGVGKTTLAQTLARVLGLDYRRIQFTSDLLPADIVGVAIFEQNNGGFRFHPGPVFAQLVLADEVNRASPKTQSALLEAMEEQQVTAEGETRKLPQPFFVIATQNPLEQVGTFPLPESQLDRFLMRVSIGYPDTDAERELLKGGERRDWLPQLKPVLDSASLIDLQNQVRRIHTSPALLDYILALVRYTREHPGLRQGLSPRAGLALCRAAQAWALLANRSGVIPEDVQAVFAAVAGHRLVANTRLEAGAPTPEEILAAVAIP